MLPPDDTLHVLFVENDAGAKEYLDKAHTHTITHTHTHTHTRQGVPGQGIHIHNHTLMHACACVHTQLVFRRMMMYITI